ncbi:hypothetical protein TWF281_007617 [Arthrobotrys megalospora]
MYGRRLLTTIASAGLLLVPFASGQFPGKNTVDSGEGGGAGDNFEVAATGTREAPPSQTTLAIPISGTCNSPYQLLGLSNAYPYMPVVIDGITYNFAISFEEEKTYIFSFKFCQNFLTTDPNGCLFTGDAKGEGTDDGKDTINTGQDGFEFEYFESLIEARIGTDENNIVLKNYPIRVVKDLESNNGDLLRSRFRDGQVHGILGLKNTGNFIEGLSLVCKKPAGWGIHLQPGSFFSFGGIDSMASSIGTNDTSGVLSFSNKYNTAEIRPIIPGFNSARDDKYTTPVILDTTVSYNTVPIDISSAVEGGFVSGASAEITIAGVTFTIPWTSLAHAGSEVKNEGSTLILGTPFFQHIYAAMFPEGSERQGIVIAQDKGLEQAEFKPFPRVEKGLPTKTQPSNGAGGVATSSARPDRKADDANEDEPASEAVSPAMTKSGNNIGAIVGGVVGGVVGLLIIVVATCCFYRRRKLMKSSPRGIEKEYEAEFDAEIGHHDGFFPQFKESGYATLPTPPPPPPQARPQIPSLILGSPINLQYDSQTEYTPTLHPYHDESPSRSLNVTPLPPPAQTPILTIPPVPERRLSVTPSLSIEPPSPLSRNVSAASRRDFPNISQLQRSRSNVGAVPEEDDYDVVSMASGPAYRNPILASQEAASSAPRLPFMHRPESDRGMGMIDRSAGL